jgi:hypothetical protein
LRSIWRKSKYLMLVARCKMQVIYARGFPLQ